MNAEQYLNEALGGNMNISTLKPLAWHEIMEGYARHKLAEAQAASTNKQSTQSECDGCGNKLDEANHCVLCSDCYGMVAL